MSTPSKHPRADEISRVAELMIKEWERVEGKPVNISYVSTFCDMARVLVEDTDRKLADLEASLTTIAPARTWNPPASPRHFGRKAGRRR